MKESSEKLLSGLNKNTEERIKSILESAEKKSAEKKKDADRRYNQILEKGKKEAETRYQEIKSKIDSNLRIELKRKNLKFRDRLLKEILSCVKEMFHNTEPEKMRKILYDWTLEAGISLNSYELVLSVFKEYKNLINKNFISNAEKEITQYVYRDVSLKLSGEYLSEPGIIVTSGDRRVAFNNNLSTRIKRMEKDIRNIVYQNLLDKE